ncbi:transporter substrate-binding domain-containing protein [Desulfobotulus sp. H1]|uniref:Transporter substrate-binding domain-containing protein n=1 Tax=Desulfobotulus pelophilus TaxID=2823377 RepID=A0ABT3N5F4_9BACT|nr:transporter substrate-binding domain-containing protein [Desulfobotulus pelophilus]MCW7752693.1 transporter substrate-binding domain-containing protein [Desulfobotulus pelophilus]
MQQSMLSILCQCLWSGLFGLCLFSPVQACCAELPAVLHIATPQWEGQTNADGSGFFFEVVQKIYEPHGIRVSWEFANWNRSMDLVAKQHADAMPSIWKEDAEAAGLKLPRLPLYIEYTVAVLKRTSIPDWQGIASLRGRKAVWLRGYDYHFDTPLEAFNLKWEEVASEEALWRMLAADRVDVIIEAGIDVDRYMTDNMVDTTVYGVKPLWGQKAYLAFSPAASSEKLMALFDEGMAAMLVSGELAVLHEKWGVTGFMPSAWERPGERVQALP